jgi:hypothetical protein
MRCEPKDVTVTVFQQYRQIMSDDFLLLTLHVESEGMNHINPLKTKRICFI